MIAMKTTVLAFGHIPKHLGGRQQQGLAAVMWETASHMADAQGGLDVVFCATDVNASSTVIDGVRVIGWTVVSLLWGVAVRPVRFAERLFRMIGLCRKYSLPLLRTTFKVLLLEHAIARVKPDVLHLHGCEAAVYLEAGVFRADKTIVTLHGVHGPTGGRNLFLREEALNRIKLRFLVFVTNQIATEWRATYGQADTRAVVIANAFDRRAFFLEEEGSGQKGGVKDLYHLVSVGSIGDHKGQPQIIEGLIRHNASGAKFEIDYSMIGRGKPALVEDLLKRAAAAGIRVRHTPYLSPPQIRAQLRDADYMILASAKEGFGLVFLESIACGVPVVLPKNLPICGEPGIISDANAVLLESSSVGAILAFLVDLPSHTFLGKNVASSLPAYSWDTVGAQYRELLGLRP